MAGTIPLSMTQQFDVYGKPLAGGQLYIIAAGTVSTPQDAFQDTNLTIKQPYPMSLDAAGRVPQFFLADASVGGNSTVKIRLQDKNGVVQLAVDSVLVIGPSGGAGGGGATVDPTQLIQTGNMILRYGVGALAGYVRMNGLSIGNATSGATERANQDCQNCYQYLWGTDPNLVVGGGRGANALADWTASKPLFLPDWRGYAVGCLDDMGNVAAGRLTSAFWGGNPIQLGSGGGSEKQNLSIANINSFQPTGSFFNGSIMAGATATLGMRNLPASFSQSTDTGRASGGFAAGSQLSDLNLPVGGNVQGSISINALGAGTAHSIASPLKLCTLYIKL